MTEILLWSDGYRCSEVARGLGFNSPFNCLDPYSKRDQPCHTFRRRFDAYILLCKPCESELGVCYEGSHDKIRKALRLQGTLCYLNLKDVGIL